MDNNTLNVNVGADTSDLIKGLDKGEDALKDFGKATTSLSNTQDSNAKKVTKYSRSYDDLGKIILEQKEITIEFEKELASLENQIKETNKAAFSPKRAELIKEANQLKTAIKEQRISLKELNLEKQKSVKSDTSIIGNLKKTSQLTQVLDRHTGGLASAYLDVSKAAKVSGKAMKSALIASGIGIALAIVSEIAENWDAIGGFISGANDKLREQKRLNSEILKQLDRQNFLRDLNEGLIDSETEFAILRAEIAGKSERQLFNIRKEGAKKFLAESQRQYNEANKILKNSTKADEEEYKKAIKNQEDATKRLIDSRKNLTRVTLNEQKRIAQASRKRFKVSEITGLPSPDAYFEFSKKSRDAFDRIAQELNNGVQTAKDIIKPIPIDELLFNLPKLTEAGLAYRDEMFKRLFGIKSELDLFNEDLNNLVGQGIEGALGNLGNSIGNALGNGTNVLKAAGAAMLGAFADILIKYGSLVIAFGIAKEGLAKSLKNPFGGGIGAVLAGTALVAAGAAIKAFSGSISGGGGSGSGGPRRTSTGGGDGFTGSNFSPSGNSNGGGTVVFEIAGTKLVGVLSKTLSRNSALGGQLSIT